MLLELLKTCEQHIDFSFKCFLSGYGILLTGNCFAVFFYAVSRLRAIFYFSFRSLLLSDTANNLKLNFTKDFRKSLGKYL